MGIIGLHSLTNPLLSPVVLLWGGLGAELVSFPLWQLTVWDIYCGIGIGKHDRSYYYSSAVKRGSLCRDLAVGGVTEHVCPPAN